MSRQTIEPSVAAGTAGRPARPGVGSVIGRAFQGSGGATVGLILLFVLLAFTAPNFLRVNNLVNIVDQVTVLGILALGATAVIITGGIDLSVGAVLGLSVMVLGWVSHQGGQPMWIAMIAAIAVGAVAGLINGIGITVGKLPPFIATLAMMSIARGLANLITDGQQIVGYPEWFFFLSSNRYFGFLSVTAMVLIVLYILGWAFLRYRKSGRSLYAIGGGLEVARLAGLDVKGITVGVYITAGALAGLASLAFASRLDSSQPNAGLGIELDVIAAVVIGGASLNGGVGRIGGTIAGVLIIGILRNGLNLLGISPFIQQIIIGLVIAIAVMTDVLRRRKS